MSEKSIESLLHPHSTPSEVVEYIDRAFKSTPSRFGSTSQKAAVACAL